MRRLLSAVFICIAVNAPALDDTPANRTAEAERYLKTTPPEALFKDAADQMAMTLPPESRKEFKDLMTKYVDIAAITKVMKDAMVKNFTADELKALADFYGSPVGQSAMKKFGVYMADVSPAVQAEMLKAHAEAIKAQAAANREKQDPEK